MKRRHAALATIVLTLSPVCTPLVYADTVAATTAVPKVFITEFATSMSVDASHEYVELYNADQAAVDISSWKIIKRTKKGASSATQFVPLPTTLNKILQPGERVVYTSFTLDASTALPTGSATGKLSDAGGYLELSRGIAGELPVDEAEWGTGLAEGAAALLDCEVEASTSTYQSTSAFKRVQNDDGEFEVRFCRAAHPTPGVEDGVMVTDVPLPVVEPEPSQTELPGDTTEEPTDSDTTGGVGADIPEPEYALIAFSELLIDPIAPQTDDKDEYIELFNPTDEQVHLKDYRLEAGASWQTGYNFTDEVVIESHGYIVVTSAVSPISLTNSGGQLRLLNPAGDVIEILQYPAAKAGEAWMKNTDGQWDWTTKPTPNAPNELAIPLPLPAPIAKLVTPKKPAAPKKVAAKKATTAKKPAAAKAAKTKKASETNTKTPFVSEDADKQPTNYMLLGATGSAALGYGVYEYRQDLVNFLRRFRRVKAEE